MAYPSILTWAFSGGASLCAEVPACCAPAECIAVESVAVGNDIEQGLPRLLGREQELARDQDGDAKAAKAPSDEDAAADSGDEESTLPTMVPLDSLASQSGARGGEERVVVPTRSGSDVAASSPSYRLQGTCSMSWSNPEGREEDGDAITRRNSISSRFSAVSRALIPARSISSRMVRTVSSIGKVLSSSMPESIEDMDRRREEKRLEREHAFDMLVRQKEPTEEDADLLKSAHPSPWVSLRSVAGGALGAFYVFGGFASIPMKDIILPENAGHWWECMLQCATMWTWATAAMLIVTTYSVMMNKNSGFPFKSYVKVCLVGSSMIVGVWAAETFFWHIGKKVYPLPWVGGIAGQLSLYTMAFATFFTFPSAWLRDPVFRKRAFWLVVTFVTFNMFLLGYWFLGAAFVLLPEGRKWLLTPLVPVLREAGGFLITKYARKAAASTDFSVEIIVTNLMATAHALFLSICLTALVPELVGYVLLGIDFLTNLYLGLKATRLHNHPDEEKRNACSESLQIMLLNESLEFFIPLAYLGCFLVAWYGPNAPVLGNIRNGYWQNSAQDDIVASTKSLLMLTAIDGISVIINGVVMYFRNGVNLWKVFLFMQKEWGWVMAVQQAFVIEQQFCVVAIGCAIDLTFKFDWL